MPLVHFCVEANVYTCFLSVLGSGPAGGSPLGTSAERNLHSE